MSELDGETSPDDTRRSSDNAGVFPSCRKVALTVPEAPLSYKKWRTARKGGRSRVVNKLAGEGLPVIRGVEGSRVVYRCRRRFRETHVDQEGRERKRQSAYVRREHLIIQGIFPSTTDYPRSNRMAD